ncbi:glycoside hydrolase family 3 protein [Croceibacterium sp. LX-88]|uniref:Glycoside hydrolase family 3 protein n=1 Tax=Croceibacterium selenioxidans TaxID=2838833 RepID=A0ABS5W6J2_9SPHN|nr:glycoside hydrolase family 3 protein [Croceibacterium selenioxidans]MBT2134938.1 glycoside hydrolase family 3 protein [Croceibacterium selenioxidans]
MRSWAVLTMAAALTAGGASLQAQPASPPAQGSGVANPAIWPERHYPVPVSAADEAKIADLLRRMTLEEKIGQLVQADLCCVTPADVKTYNLGSVLNGGNSGPYGNDLAPAADWLKLADEFYAASIDTSDGGVGIPVVWGTDAVHGHSNIIGATLFPHNIGLGAMRDPELIERIGAVTATEIRVTGQEWTFAPTVAVPQDFRWGRAYEGYSSNPELVASYTGAMVRGLQGPPDGARILPRGKVIASTKHFLGDGGTANGVDQGDAQISEEELRDIHGAPYGPAIEEGVGTVMASFSSWQGVKMTGNQSLLTGVLKDRMNFGGFVVSDWNAHGQVEGCTNASCPQALLAGIDLYMAPDTWKPIYESLLAQAKAGQIPMSRIDDAVTRLLRVKLRLGLFETGKPSSRDLSGHYELLGSAEHRAVAREAVRKSLVLLKNQGVLPLKPGGRLLVAGDGADDIARQSGGWTLTWQGTGIDNSHFPGATSLWAGLREAVTSAGGSAELSPGGSFTTKPDAAIVIFGEKPYAEFQGDRASLQLDPELTAPFETMRKLKAQGIPVVAVMITGRPLYVNPALNLADAFVVTWLPGTEGGGLADVLVGKPDGTPRFDFQGKLPADWPRTANMADGVLHPFGFGLNYASPRAAWTPLAEDAGNAAAGDARTFLASGVPASSWSLHIVDPSLPGSQTRITTFPAEALGGRAKVSIEEGLVQEGGRRFRISGGTSAVSLGTFDPIDISRETNGDVMLLVTLKMLKAPQQAGFAMISGTDTLVVSPVTMPQGTKFVRYGLSLKCLREKGVDMSNVATPFILSTEGAADFVLTDVRLGTDAEVVLPCG